MSQTHCAGICGQEGDEEVFIGCIFYVLVRLTANRERFRLG